jgi:hypothetical protein
MLIFFRARRLWGEYHFDYGVKERIARELGVHRSTITRDLRPALKFEREVMLRSIPR